MTNFLKNGINLSNENIKKPLLITTIAGIGTPGLLNNEKLATTAQVRYPAGVAVDTTGVYIADYGNNRIRFIPILKGNYFGQDMSANFIYTIAGTVGVDFETFNGDQLATSAQVNAPYGVAVNTTGVYIADTGNQRIRFIPIIKGRYFDVDMSANFLYTIAGTGIGGSLNPSGLAKDAQLSGPRGVAVDTNGVYIADTTNHRIRFIPIIKGRYFNVDMSANFIYTIAGNGSLVFNNSQLFNGDNQLATDAQLYQPFGLAVDKIGVYIADYNNQRIRFIPITKGRYFNVDMSANFIYTIAGTGTSGFNGDQLATSAQVNYPQGVAVDTTGVYIADSSNRRIRFIPIVSGYYFNVDMSANFIYTIAGIASEGFGQFNGDQLATNAELITPYGVALDTIGNIYIADNAGHRIRKLYSYNYTIDSYKYTNTNYYMTANYIYSIAGDSSGLNGTGTAGFNGDNQLATNAQVIRPYGVCVDTNGNVYFADYIGKRIRFIPILKGNYFGVDMSANFIYTIAGTGTSGFDRDNQLAINAKLTDPRGVAVDTRGVYIADTDNYKIRFIPIKQGYYFGEDMSANFIYTIAGNGIYGFNGDNQLAKNAQLSAILAICLDRTGNVYFSDYFNHKIRFIPINNGRYFDRDMSANFIYTIAGTGGDTLAGTGGFNGDNQLATNAQVNRPPALCIDSIGNVYISDTVNAKLRFIPIIKGNYFGRDMSANFIYSIAGTGGDTLAGTAGFNGDNQLATTAQITYSTGLAVDTIGVYIADTQNQKIRFIPIVSGNYFGQNMSANFIYTIAGTGTAGILNDNQLATTAQVNYPYGLAVDTKGVYIADYDNNKIRFIPIVSGNYFGKDLSALLNNYRYMSPNFLYTIAGDGTAGVLNNGKLATTAQVNNPYGVCVDTTGVYFADYDNQRIRFIPIIKGNYFGQDMSANFIYTIAGDGTAGVLNNGKLATTAQVNNPRGVAVDTRGVYIGDYGNKRIRFIPILKGNYFGQDMSANFLYTIAGTGTAEFNGDNQLATSAQLNLPRGVAVDARGVYIADSYNHKIRFIPIIKGNYFGRDMSANFIYSIAGTGGDTLAGTAGFNGDQLATNGQLLFPEGITVDTRGVYIADTQNQRIRFIPIQKGRYFDKDMSANFIYTIAGNENQGFNGDQLATTAQLNRPQGVAVDTTGVYIADYGNERIRFIPIQKGRYFDKDMSANFIYTIAGTGTAAFNQDGLATTTQLNRPYGVAVDTIGNVYIADTNNQRIRFIKYQNTNILNNYVGQSMSVYDIYTIAGTGTAGSNAAQSATTGLLNNPMAQSVDLSGNIYIADTNNHRIQFIPIASGTYFNQIMNANWMYTIAGTGTAGLGTAGVSDEVIGTSGQINTPHNVFVNLLGNVYIPDYGNNKIRFIPRTNGKYHDKDMSANFIYTIAGTGAAGTSIETLATNGIIQNPTSIFVDNDENMYIAQRETHRITFIPRKTNTYFDKPMTANWMYTIAGNGTLGFNDEVLAKDSILNTPFSVWVDSSENIYIAERDSSRIKFIPRTKNRYFDKDMSANFIYTIAGNGSAGFLDEVLAKNSILNIPCTVCTDFEGNVYFGERDGHRVRFIPRTTNNYFGRDMVANFVYTIAGNGNSSILTSPGVSVDSIGNVYIGTRGNNQIKFIPNKYTKIFSKPMIPNYMYTIVGTGIATTTTNTLATKSGLNLSYGIYIDSNENMYIIDRGNHRILFIPVISGTYFGISMMSNFTYSIAGTGTAAFNGDQLATNAQIYNPSGVTVDTRGVYISDCFNDRLRFIPFVSGRYFDINMTANFIYTIAGTGTAGVLNDEKLATTAQLNRPRGLAVDTKGVYITDCNNSRIRFIPITNGRYFDKDMSANFIYTIAGTGTEAFNQDGLATTTQLNRPFGVALDTRGLYIADADNNRIRFIPILKGRYFDVDMSANFLYTIAGNGTNPSGLAKDAQVSAPRAVAVDTNGIYIADSTNSRIRFIPITKGNYFGVDMSANFIYTIAGTGTAGFNGDQLATNAQLNEPFGVDVDTNGNVYIGDFSNHRIRFIFNKSNYNYNFPTLNSGYYTKNVDAFYYNKTIKSDIF